LLAVRPGNQRVAISIAALQCNLKKRPDESGAGADDECQQGKREQTALALRAFDVEVRVDRHRCSGALFRPIWLCLDGRAAGTADARGIGREAIRVTIPPESKGMIARTTPRCRRGGE
jgi:hypothetical protein